MTTLTRTLGNLGKNGIAGAMSLTAGYNALTNSLNRSYRQTRLCCKKLCRCVKKICATADAEKVRAQVYERERIEALRKQEDARQHHHETMALLMYTFMAMFASTGPAPQAAAEPDAPCPAPH